MTGSKFVQKGSAALALGLNRRVSLEEAMRLAYGRWNAGQSGQAEHLCRQVLAAAANHASALHLLGLIAHACGKPDLAIAYLTKACAAPEASALFHSNLTVMCRAARPAPRGRGGGASGCRVRSAQRRDLEHTRRRAAGAGQAGGKPREHSEGAGSQARFSRDAQQSRQHANEARQA